MSKAILSPGACTQVSFSCEELWNSLFTIGALCFPFPNLKCLWNALFWLEEGCVHSPWECLTISSVTCGRSRSTSGTFTAHTSAQLLALAVWKGSRLGSKQALTCHSSLGSINCSSHFLVSSPLPSPPPAPKTSHKKEFISFLYFVRKLSKAHWQYRCGILLMGLYFEFSLLGFFSSNSFLQHSLMLQAVVSTADAPCCCCQLRVHVGSLPPISFTPPKALSGKKQLMPLTPCQVGSAQGAAVWPCW